jgi:hypothetical protein
MSLTWETTKRPWSFRRSSQTFPPKAKRQRLYLQISFDEMSPAYDRRRKRTIERYRCVDSSLCEPGYFATCARGKHCRQGSTNKVLTSASHITPCAHVRSVLVFCSAVFPLCSSPKWSDVVANKPDTSAILSLKTESPTGSLLRLPNTNIVCTLDNKVSLPLGPLCDYMRRVISMSAAYAGGVSECGSVDPRASINFSTISGWFWRHSPMDGYTPESDWGVCCAQTVW